MSYIQFQQQCESCKGTWNAAFGMVNTTIIAHPPNECPYCGSENISRFAEGWGTPAPSDGMVSGKGTLRKVDAKNETLPQADHIANAGKMIPTPSTGSDVVRPSTPGESKSLRSFYKSLSQKSAGSDAPHSEIVDCPALHEQSEHYPASWHGRVPKTIRMEKRVTADLSEFFPEHRDMVAMDAAEYPAWTNEHGAVAAILPSGKQLGVKPYEFEVVVWYPSDATDGQRDPAKSSREAVAQSPNRLEQLESIVRQLADALEHTQIIVHHGQHHQWNKFSDCDSEGCVTKRDLIRRSRELTQHK